MNASSEDIKLFETADGATSTPLFTPGCGSGPGLLLLSDADIPEASLSARAMLLAEEGYTVLAPRNVSGADDINNAARALAALPTATGAPVCIAHGDVGVAALQSAEAFAAMVVFDAPRLATDAGVLGSLSCPVVLQFGTRDAPDATAAAAILARNISRTDGSRVYTWPDAAPGFALPGAPAFDSRVDSLAHSRTLELIRRVVGPYYDYVALFAEHPP